VITELLDEYGRCDYCAVVCIDCDEPAESLDEYGRCYGCTVVCGECCECAVVDIGLCDGCTSESEYHRVFCYDYKHNFQKYRWENEEENAYFGIEIEVEAKYCISELADHIPDNERWIGKKDGSLENGLEYVSAPMTIKRWRDESMEWLSEVPGTSWDTSTCGMHVHVSRDAFSRLTWAKIERWIRTDASFFEFIARRRTSEELDRWASLSDDGWTPAQKAKHGSSRRYSALNLTSKTGEFRLFRGTKHPENAKRNIELVNAMMRYAQDESYSKISGKRFRNWMMFHGEKKLECKDASTSLLDWTSRCV